MRRRQILKSTAAFSAALILPVRLARSEEIPPELMAPGPLPEQSFGKEDAPVTVIEYASMTCGHCQNFHLNTWPEIDR